MTARAPLFRDALGTRKRLGEVNELVLHLASRQLRSSHRRSVLGWVWPLLIQLVQLAVLVFVFDRVLPLGVDDYPLFVFCGLVFWSWFRGGLTRASTAVTDNAPLVLEPRTPRAVLPLVSLAVATFDLLVALPVLLVVIVLVEGIHATWVVVPGLLAIQLVLMAGIGYITAALHVFVRDVAQLVSLVLLMLFYVTPVFYPLDAVPDDSRWIFYLNPAADLIDAYRSALVYGEMPSAIVMGALAGASLVVLAVGWALYRRLERGFADEL